MNKCFYELSVKRIIALLFTAAALFISASCATTEYNPTCLKECERGNRECTQSCAALRIPLPEGAQRSYSHNRGISGFDNCAARCESTYRKCKKRCERVMTIDGGNNFKN